MARSPGKSPKHAPKPPAPEAVPPKEDDLKEPARQLRILVIDDDAVDRMTLRRALDESRLNPIVEEATDLASGLEAVRKSPYDVVILDHLLPDGKSIDFLRTLRDHKIRMPIVVTTGYGDEMLVVDLLKTGASDYLSKDKISADTISRAISHAIRVHRTEEELRKQELLLQGVAQAATLLETHGERLTVVNEALAILAAATAVDRAVVFEQTVGPRKELLASHRHEWNQGSEDFVINSSHLQNVTYETLGLARFQPALAAGHTVGGPVKTLPDADRQRFEAEGVRSFLLLPVLVDTRFWGFVRLDDRRTERTWSQNEKSILVAMASGIGSALAHRRAEEVLRHSEERYRSTVEDQMELICRLSPGCAITFANEAFCKHVGRKREELAGVNFLDLVPEGERKAVWSRLAQLTWTKPVGSIEYGTRMPDGSTRWLRWTSRALFDPRGGLVEFLTVGHDTTDWKRGDAGATPAEADSRWRVLIEQIPAVTYIAALDEHSTTQFVSPQIEKILGFTPADYTADPDLWRQRLHPEDRDRVMAELDRAVKAMADVRSEYRMLAKDGHVVWFEDRGSYLRNEQGRPIALHGVMYDISDQKRAEESARLSEERARAQYRAFPVPTFTWQKSGDDFVLADYNDAALAITRGGVATLRGERLSVIHHDMPEAIRAVWDCYNDRRTVRLETDYRFRTTGETKRVKVSCVFAPPDQVMVHTEDVSAQAEATRIREESRGFLDEIVNRVADPIFVKDDQHRFVLGNNALCEFLGHSREELIGRSDPDFFPREQVEVFWKNDDEVLRTGAPNLNEEQITGADGATRTIMTKKARYVEPSGRRLIVGVIRDVTDIRRAEQALRESEERYRTLAEGSPDMIYVLDREGLVQYVNSAAAAHFRCRPEDLVGKRQGDLFPPDMAQRHAMAIRTVFETGKPYRADALESSPAGGRWLDTRLIPLKSPAGEVVAILGLSRDVTERRQIENALRESEANFRALADNAMDGILILGGNGLHVYANRRATEITGFSADELIAMGPGGLLHPSESKRIVDQSKDRLAGRAAPNRYETLIVRKDGHTIRIEVSATMTTWRGQPAALVIIRDISEQKKAEDERRHLAASLLDIQEEERKKISAALHDHLGQLLTLTRLELGSVAVKDNASKKSVENALQRLDEALDSVRRLAVSLRPPILDDLGIEAALETLTEEFADGSGIETSFSRKGPVPQITRPEETCLYRVLQEALTNAAKHSGATLIEVALRADEVETRLEVRDNGKGFDAEVSGSKGLGVIGMRERLRQCGGSLDVSSEKGSGVSIVARIPRRKAANQEPPA